MAGIPTATGWPEPFGLAAVLTPQQLLARWDRCALSERSACQQHFIDLCDLLGHERPAEADPEGTWYTFERGVRKTDGGQGFADVWKRGHFGWEYKRQRSNLNDAYNQLLLYREALENPPLLIVCDLQSFQVHTNFTGTPKQVYQFDLRGLAEPANLNVLRKAFVDPEALRPGRTTASITQEAADRFGVLADGMRNRGVPSQRAAHFLTKLIFCMFAEDIRLLPEQLFARTVKGAKRDPAKLSQRLRGLFRAMAKGGDFGTDEVDHFNGGLFDDAEVIDLTPNEIDTLVDVNEFDWREVEPSIFGTLFERTLDPAKRSQIGAHYTGRDDIVTLLEPVMMAPLRREWGIVREQCEALVPRIRDAARVSSKKGARRRAKDSDARRDFDRLLIDFDHRLSQVTVLDPACGSGNFLYVAIHLLLGLEKEVVAYGQSHGVGLLPQVRPTQLAGIEINRYAQQLAQVVIWIGYLQWMEANGFSPPRNPVLEPIESVRCGDAILDLTDPDNPVPTEWPAADFIVGNPPFLGGKRLRSELGDSYVDAMFHAWSGRVKPEADLCVYWFEEARNQIEGRKAKRVGLLATQGIRGGANRETLKRIKESGDIFWAESDRNWVLDGATVHVSMVGFDGGHESERVLDGLAVDRIHPNLTARTDITRALILASNVDLAYMGITPSGPFVIEDSPTRQMLLDPNPHRCPNSDVLLPWVNGADITRRSSFSWIIDLDRFSEAEAASRFAGPFQVVSTQVKSARSTYRTGGANHWKFERPRPAMRKAIAALPRFLCTPRVSKHRLFVWLEAPTLPDSATFVFAREDDYFFGILHSIVHETWARSQGTQLRERESGFRYTPTTCFETFPFPEPSAGQRATIAAAARELDALRNAWLNPPEWTREEILEFPGSTDGPWKRYVRGPDSRGIGTVRFPRIVPKDAGAAKMLAKRTLTNLYNERPTWLDLAHRKLDKAVFAAYGWPASIGDDELLERLLELNLSRAG